MISGAKLTDAMIQAYNAYIENLESTHQQTLTSETEFLYFNRQSHDKCAELRRKMEEMGFYIVNVQDDLSKAKRTTIPHATLFHFLGGAFIEGVTLQHVMEITQDFDHYKKYYHPAVQESRLIHKHGNVCEIFLRLYRKTVFPVVLNTYYTVTSQPITSARTYSISRLTKIREVKYAGTSHERELPEGQDSGYLWQTTSYWRTQQTHQGVWMEGEYVTLSRDIPWGANLLIGDYIKGLARQSYEFSILKTKDAILKRK